MDTDLTSSKRWLAIGFIVMGLAVALGAFGAHGLEGKVDAKLMATYQTGVQYHLIHGLALITCALGISHKLPLRICAPFFLFGICVFSGGCYLYTFTQIKTFALVVPLGGVSFLIAWFLGGYKLLKMRNA